jgi:cobalt-zinc-cadmium efflux system membrane fusion protein
MNASSVGRAGRILSSLVVFALLGGLLFWAFRNEGKLPKFSEWFGDSSHRKSDWCETHSVPESICIECKPELMARHSFGWCAEHGVHDCPLCHPEVAELLTPTTITDADRKRATDALAFKERPKNGSRCKLHERRIQFASETAVKKAGIGIDTVWTAPMMEFVAGNGELVYDQIRTARLSARAPGTVFRVFKQVGDPVRQGDILALVDAADVGKAKAEFLQALVQTRLKSKLMQSYQAEAKSGTVAARSVLEVETALSEARIRLATAQQALVNLGMPVRAETFAATTDIQLADQLRFLGLPKIIADTLDPQSTTGNLVAIVAPLDGVVTRRDTVPGEHVDPMKTLFVVVDPRQMWLLVDIRIEDAQAVSLGKPIRFRHEGAREEAVGQVEWISTEADHKTRTVKVRAVLPNADGKLRANTFGTGRIILREEPKAIVVPTAAVQWEGDCFVVFVQDRNYAKDDPGRPTKVFHTRDVRLGAKDEGKTEIIAGVLPGEIVVTDGSALLRAELLKGNIGDGCGCGK